MHRCALMCVEACGVYMSVHMHGEWYMCMHLYMQVYLLMYV